MVDSQKQFLDFLVQQGRNGHSAIIILTFARLERKIENILKSKMPNTSSSSFRKNLFHGRGAPLGTASAKFDVAYALGIIDEKLWNDMTTLKEIRNDFAHPDQENLHLDTPEMLKLLEKFPDYDDHNGKMVRIAYWQAKIGDCMNALDDLKRPLPNTSTEISS